MTCDLDRKRVRPGSQRRHVLALAVGLGVLSTSSGWSPADEPSTNPLNDRTKNSGIRGTRAQLRDGWLSADAVVLGTYEGVDSTLGRHYHTADVQEVWMGTPAPGRLVFKAPRGIRTRPDEPLLLLLWDRLSGVPDSYLEESQKRFGDQTWAQIGPDSLAVYLLPFASYAYPFQDGKLVLRGRGPFPTKLDRRKLRRELFDYEQTLLPKELYRAADAVLWGRVRNVERKTLEQFDVVLEHRMFVDLDPIQTLKGSVPEPIQLQFGSFPRSPRFSTGEEVIVILSRDPDGTMFLEHGKRSVFHVEAGEVLEVGQPLSEFLKSLQGT